MASEWRVTEYGNVNSAFTKHTLAKLCVGKYGIQTGPFGSQLHKKDYVNVGTPIITVEHLGDNRIHGNDFPCVSVHDKERLKKFQLLEGDIVFSRVGSVDRRALVREKESDWLFSGRCLRVRVDKERVDSTYLSYFFGFEGFKEYVRGVAVGATMPSINTKILSELPIFLPPLPEQKAIAHILGSLDDKIELNRQMNQTLEHMAQAMFKSWFVDFDPVIDNALAQGNEIPEELQPRAEQRLALGDKRQPLPEHIQKLFPSEFEFSGELDKWVPKGWSCGNLSDISDVVGGGTPSTKVPENFCKDGIPWLSPKDLSGYEWKYISKGATDITEIGLKNSSAKLMPKGTVLFSSRAPIGYVAIAENEICTNQGFKSLVPKEGICSDYLFYFLKSNIESIEAIATGSTFKEVSGTAIKNFEIIIPDIKILQSFERQTKYWNEKSLVNQKELESLTKLRDSLLPMLISGEVRVSDLDLIKEEVL